MAVVGNLAFCLSSSADKGIYMIIGRKHLLLYNGFRVANWKQLCEYIYDNSTKAKKKHVQGRKNLTERQQKHSHKDNKANNLAIPNHNHNLNRN